MKKYLIALAALAMVLVGCKQQGGGGSEYTKISFKQTEISIAQGETYKLIVLYEPTSLDAPACEWSTSNAEVATVNNGTVTAVAPGEANITAKHGDLTAVCKVTVTTVYGAYMIEDYGVFGAQPAVWVEGSDTTIAPSWAGGKSYHCRLGYWYVLAWDGNVTYVDKEGLQGEGFLLYSLVPFYTVDDTQAGEDNGTPFGWGSFKLKDTNKDERNIGKAGKLDQAVYCEYMDSYITEILAGGDGSNIKWNLLDSAITGAIIFVADYTGDEPSWSYTDNGLVYSLVKDLTLIWDNDSQTFAYEADIDWFNNLEEDRFFGLKYTEEGTVKPYNLSIISEHYSVDYAQLLGAPAFSEPKKITKRHNEIPEIRMGRTIVTDKLIKK